MDPVKLRAEVIKVEAEPPQVRVTARFSEGGNQHRNAQHNTFDFLVGQFDQPKVGDHVAMVVAGPIPHDKSLDLFIEESVCFS